MTDWIAIMARLAIISNTCVKLDQQGVIGRIQPFFQGDPSKEPLFVFMIFFLLVVPFHFAYWQRWQKKTPSA